MSDEDPFLKIERKEMANVMDPMNNPTIREIIEGALKKEPKELRECIERIEFEAIGYKRRGGVWVDSHSGREADKGTIAKVMGDVDRLMLVRNPKKDEIEKMFRPEE